ncbi:uncharacterized protein LOC106867736 isoform X2 [Octopus bimaculoides]|uniref:Apple domain-containing protein n=1 Tax=Octopus bimaculoides TaxID=37653 RepID=A0A0L8HZ03_OCTBM|nr:uncharacterized protein LOC106867736 isoform X2 [Octopus bimaculoides]|eukprot:XP_014768183.1 PREDICTED: uncharacterized protein LOC106867736 [Octopus bimaculoides]
MNLKEMKTPIQYHLLLISLPVLVLVFFVTARTGESACIEVLFREVTASKCLTDPNKITGNTTSAEDCALQCILQNECEYFTYCKNLCYMHQSFYDEEIKDSDCNCLSYILISGNSTSWQKVFEMTVKSFKRSPVYLYWDKLPIKKVEFRVRKTRVNEDDYLLVFNGTGTDSTSWFQKDKIIVNQQNQVLRNLTFKEKDPHFRIEWGASAQQGFFEARRKPGNNEEFDIFLNIKGTKVSLEALVVSVQLK